MSESVKTSILGGWTYFLLVFVIGFIFGAIRSIEISPRWGEVVGVVIETPLLLGVCWFVAKMIIKYMEPERSFRSMAILGGSAFVFLMVTEFVFSILVFRQTPTTFIKDFGETAGLIGLAAQILFALIPFFYIKRSSTLVKS